MNPLFKQAVEFDVTQYMPLLRADGWQRLSQGGGTLIFTKEGVGVISLDSMGWTVADEQGKELDFGSSAKDLAQYLQVKPSAPEKPFLRGKQFQKQPEAQPEERPEVLWLDDEKGEQVPEFTDADLKQLKTWEIRGSLKRKVVAAYMNGYAEHAAKWLRDRGHSYTGSEKYAESNGLKPDYFREAIQTMSRYAAYTKKKTAGRPERLAFSVPLASASHVAYVLSEADLTYDYTNDDAARLTTFVFQNEMELEAAHELIYQNFKRQIDSGKDAWANWKELEARPDAVRPISQSRSLMSSLTEESDMADSPFQEINDPVCLCTHTFHDHEGGCDNCDCIGFDPAPMEKQVAYVCERRSFGRVGKMSNPATYERHDGEMKLKVWFKDGRVEKAQFSDRDGGKASSRPGWDGFFSFTQAYGD